MGIRGERVMTSGKKSRPGQSDSPPPDLKKERDEVLRSLTKGSRLTEEFLAEQARLLQRLSELEAENASLRAKVEADDAIRKLVNAIEQLEKEKQDLLSRYHEAEAVSSRVSERFQEVEAEFASLANLFVASSQIHSSLSPRGVVRRIKEVLAQLVGAERYAVYLANGDKSELVPIASEGLAGDELTPRSTESGPLAEVFRSGGAAVDEECDPSRGTLDDPPAVIPLSIDGEAVGIIAIYSTLSQKTKFQTIDFELFKLLGQHAATSLVSASLFVQAERRIPGLEAFLDLSV